MNNSLPFPHLRQALLKDYSTFGIGGPASYFTQVHSVEELQGIIRFCYTTGLRYFLLGKGSNCLFDDRGYEGLVILNRIDYLKQQGTIFDVGAGYSFARLGGQTARLGYSGLEFASGIPATVGGALYMNAGANGKETADALNQVTMINEQGDVVLLKKNELSFAYRFSSMQQMKGAIVSAHFELIPTFNAKEVQKEIVNYRLRTQPYGEKSIGCVFRNLSCSSAGALIDKAGLKGLSIGDAEVSQVHANFIVNKNTASAQNVLDLICMIKEKVYSQHGVHLEEEIRLVPYKDV